MGQALLRVRDVARYLQISPRTVYRLLESGQLAGLKVGKQWRVLAKDLPGWREHAEREPA